MVNSTPSSITGLMGVTRNRLRIFRSRYPATTRGSPIRPPAQMEMVQTALMDCSRNVYSAPGKAGFFW
jgi:hypothetical protein